MVTRSSGQFLPVSQPFRAWLWDHWDLACSSHFVCSHETPGTCLHHSESQFFH